MIEHNKIDGARLAYKAGDEAEFTAKTYIEEVYGYIHNRRGKLDEIRRRKIYRAILDTRIAYDIQRKFNILLFPLS